MSMIHGRVWSGKDWIQGLFGKWEKNYMFIVVQGGVVWAQPGESGGLGNPRPRQGLRRVGSPEWQTLLACRLQLVF